MNAMSPDYSVISMGQWSVVNKWTANQYGHPHQTAIELLESGTKLMREKPTKEWVGLKGKNPFKKDHPYIRFSEKTIRKSIYGTGWDGNIVITAPASGELEIQY